jgi:hypothetical protein
MYNREDVLALVRNIIEQDEEVDEFLLTLGDKELSRMIFHSPIGKGRNLRVSFTGFEFLKRAYESFEISFDESYSLRTADLLLLSERCTCPYYISQKAKSVAFFEREIASRVKFASGNLSLLF